jgi:cis-L-3-hydroxyproline dehydratase
VASVGTMKIDSVSVFPVRYTPKAGPYMLSGGRIFNGFDAFIVRIRTDDGLEGWGEHASAPSYMTAMHGGTLEGLKMLAPLLIGEDPTGIARIEGIMDRALQGHAYAKSAIDIALWDILGKKAGLPLAHLLGGVYQSEFPIFQFLPLDTPEAMLRRADDLYDQGFRHLQVKVGSTWRADVERIRTVWPSASRYETVVVDANAYWSPAEAAQVLHAVDDLDIAVEQPCRTLESNLSVRARTSKPFILDESLDSIEAVEAAHAASAFDCAMLKISRFGGISRLKTARDLCIRWGKAVTMEDMSGGAIATAASAHLAASTPPRNLVVASLIGIYSNESYGTGVTYDGPAHAAIPTGPGLGVEMDLDALGAPVWEV